MWTMEKMATALKAQLSPIILRLFGYRWHVGIENDNTHSQESHNVDHSEALRMQYIFFLFIIKMSINNNMTCIG